MKVENTEFGAERDIRARLKTIGILQPEIDELFQSANCTGQIHFMRAATVRLCLANRYFG